MIIKDPKSRLHSAEVYVRQISKDDSHQGSTSCCKEFDIVRETRPDGGSGTLTGECFVSVNDNATVSLEIHTALGERSHVDVFIDGFIRESKPVKSTHRKSIITINKFWASAGAKGGLRQCSATPRLISAGLERDSWHLVNQKRSTQIGVISVRFYRQNPKPLTSQHISGDIDYAGESAEDMLDLGSSSKSSIIPTYFMSFDDPEELRDSISKAFRLSRHRGARARLEPWAIFNFNYRTASSLGALQEGYSIQPFQPLIWGDAGLHLNHVVKGDITGHNTSSAKAHGPIIPQLGSQFHLDHGTRPDDEGDTWLKHVLLVQNERAPVLVKRRFRRPEDAEPNAITSIDPRRKIKPNAPGSEAIQSLSYDHPPIKRWDHLSRSGMPRQEPVRGILKRKSDVQDSSVPRKKQKFLPPPTNKDDMMEDIQDGKSGETCMLLQEG